jgi:repressor LexA
MTIADRIKQRRKELGYSADAVADKLGKSRATIYRYETEDVENMPIAMLEPLAKVLRTTPAYLMGWEGTEKNNDSEITELISELSEEDKKFIYTFINKIKK